MPMPLALMSLIASIIGIAIAVARIRREPKKQITITAYGKIDDIVTTWLLTVCCMCFFLMSSAMLLFQLTN